MPFAARHPRRKDRAQRPAALERLEERRLLSFSPLGFSQPDLAVSGYGAPVAAWGAPFAVTVDVRNLGSTTIPELSVPIGQVPPGPTAADAGPVLVSVFLVKSNSIRQPAVPLGTFTFDSVLQNSDVQATQTFTLPARPAGFPNFSGELHLAFVLDSLGAVPNLNSTSTAFVDPTPVTLQPPLPELVAVGLDLPPTMQPGDTVQPNIEVGNFGTVNTATQGPVTVLLVASTHKNSILGASIIASYTIDNLPALSEVPQTQPNLGDVNINRPNNVELLQGALVTLPVKPAKYFVTVVVDPQNKIFQIHNLSKFFQKHGFAQTVRPVRQVGPPIKNLPPAGVINLPSTQSSNPFPDPPYPVNVTPAGLVASGAGTGLAASFPAAISNARHPIGPVTFPSAG